MSLILHPIQTEEDLKKCAPLLVRVYNAEPWNDHWDEKWAYKKLLVSFRSPDFYGICIMEDQNIVGVLVGNLEPNNTENFFYLRDMFVDPDQQRKGIGSLLLDSIKNHLNPMEEVSGITLFTSRVYFTHAFYLKNQFEVLDEFCFMHYGKGS